jgi:hypothetical protein
MHSKIFLKLILKVLNIEHVNFKDLLHDICGDFLCRVMLKVCVNKILSLKFLVQVNQPQCVLYEALQRICSCMVPLGFQVLIISLTKAPL